jgi:hypothetical protein
MLRRNFLKIGGTGLMAVPLLRFTAFQRRPPDRRESSLWVHGSPYLGHSDYKRNLRGLSPDEIRQELVHFRTAEPWRRMILFAL